MSLRSYQSEGLQVLADKFKEGKKRVVVVLPTGGGKTVMFADMIARYIVKSNKNALILVHREELLMQARQKLYHMNNVIAEVVRAGVKHWPPGRVHVAMVETGYKRLQKNPGWFKNLGLIVIDEAHLDNFSKTMPYFDDLLIAGFTATAIAASKRRPMKDFYDDIVVCCQIEELIQLWKDTNGTEGLCPNITFAPKAAVQQSELKSSESNPDGFDQDYMEAVYTTGHHIDNTVKAYEKYALGKKTLVFNVSKTHSQLQTMAFKDAGYPARHLDGATPAHQREEVLKWFAATPDAILNNIGVLTTGFDEPSIQWVIVNKATKSLSLWLQMNGRGSRPYHGLFKSFFGTIDMGNNYRTLGEWSTDRDWAQIFWHPEKAKEGGIGGVKQCPNCEALIAVSARACRFCETVLVTTTQQFYDQVNLEFELVTKKIPISINIAVLVEDCIKAKRNSFYPLHQIKHQLIHHYRVDTITDEIAYQLIELYQQKVEEWCRLTKNDYNMFVKEKSGQWMLDELKNVYSWVPPTFQLSF